MSESPQQKQEPSDPRHFEIHKIYVKDFSLETPNSPYIFLEKWEPDVSVQMGNTAVTLDKDMHEVTLSVTVTSKVSDKTAYLVEVHQAGLFKIEGYEQNDLAALVGHYCPNILFPFARQAVADLVGKAGFPQFLLSPVNFEALYAGYVQKQKQEAEQAEATH